MCRLSMRYWHKGPSMSNYSQGMHSIVGQATQGDDKGGVWGASPGVEEDVRLSTICLAERTVCDPFTLPSSTSTKTPPGATKLHITAVAAALRELNKGQAAGATGHQIKQEIKHTFVALYVWHGHLAALAARFTYYHR